MLSSLDDYPHVKKQDITWFFFLETLMIKQPYNWIGSEAQLATPNQKSYSQMPHLLDDYLYAKNQIAVFLLEILMIEESSNLIGQTVQLATHNQKS